MLTAVKNMLFNKYVHTAMILVWLSGLAATDAHFLIYAMIGFCGFYFLWNKPDKKCKLDPWMICLLVILFSVAVFLANYPIFAQIRDPERVGASTNLILNVINGFLCLVGGAYTFYSVFLGLFSVFPVPSGRQRTGCDRWFWIVTGGSFVFFVALNLIHLFLVEYPGNVTEDPFTQISEMISGNYSNFNTFWHTMLMQTILSVGFAVFQDVNGAVAFFCVVQLLIIAAAFSYSLSTLYRAGVPWGFLIFVFGVYGILPYNMALSITIWKDVLFAAGGLIFSTSMLRILNGLGKKQALNYCCFMLGALLFILSRTNGWQILLVCLLIFLLMLRKHRKLLVILGAAAVIGWALCGPVLTALNVAGGDYTESLSVPLQQVSRVIVDGKALSDNDQALISRVLDIEEVPELYENWISDPIKVEFRSKDTVYFEQNLGAYVRLWLRLGLKHPDSYVKAWVDQTKGYWNAGYGYAMYSETVTDNPYGVFKAERNNPIASLFRLYFGLSRHVIFFQPLHSIGLHSWILLLCCILDIKRKGKSWCAGLPCLIIVLGLCLGSPVYSAFRYAYPVFVTLPLIAGFTLFEPAERE